MADFEKDLDIARKIAEEAALIGGRAYFVGGYVRDALMCKENKDIDIEIHGVSPAELENLLDSIGERISIGESFGIYAIKGHNIDIAMPRRERATGKGHRDFEMLVDPFIGTREAAKRRDFTVNAMMQDVLTGEIIDEFGGRADLNNKVLRHVDSETFAEDELRVLRAAQFASRFEFSIAEETVFLCRGISLYHLSRERVEGEMKKALLKAQHPSVFFEVLRKMDKLAEWFPELSALIGVEQPPRHHAEGDVWNHTMMVLDEAAKLRDKTSNPFAFMLTALCHDFGKAVCTRRINGEIHAYGHETEGIPLIERFLRRITNETAVIKYVLNLAQLHMRPNALAAQKSSVKATNKMFDAAVCPLDLVYISKADHLGRLHSGQRVSYDEFLFERLEIFDEIMAKPYVLGRDLIEAGLTPGKDFGELLAYAHKLRLPGLEKEEVLRATLAYARKNKKKC